ncbi:MAG: PAS domain S-box protein [Prolixibacteraceae bacterium]|nr:PAS domain S-box protein [Prolixibacteraceae bacterium]
MEATTKENSQLFLIKEKLVNTALIVASVAAFPLLAASLFRITFIDLSYYWYTHIIIYLSIVTIMFFRKRLPYSVRGGGIILGMFALALNDFFETGFSSGGYIWLMSSTIITALFFDIRRTVYILILSISSMFIVFVLYSHNIISFVYYGNKMDYPLISVIIHAFIIILIVLILAFSLRYMQQQLIHYIHSLEQQKADLKTTTKKLRNEIEARHRSDLQVIRSNKNFHNIFEQSTEAILIVDFNGNILDFNSAFKYLSIINNKFIKKRNTLNDLPSQMRLNLEKCVNEPHQTPDRLDMQIKKTNGELLFFDCSRSIINYNNDKAIMLIIRDNTERVTAKKASYLAAINAEEKERSRFSKELHDGLGPLLSTLKIYIGMLYTNPHDNEIKERINSTLVDSISTVKEISNNLSPYILENLGLIKAIETFIEKIKYSKKISVNFFSDINQRFTSEIEISVFRIITELINNTIKYASASNINISITQNNNLISILYSDDGKGFAYAEILRSKKGIGLFNLKSRVENLGGKTEISTAPGKGFKISAYITIE